MITEKDLANIPTYDEVQELYDDWKNVCKKQDKLRDKLTNLLNKKERDLVQCNLLIQEIKKLEEESTSKNRSFNFKRNQRENFIGRSEFYR